jgi:hypothetical protein
MIVVLSLDGSPSVSGLSLALLILPLGYLAMAVLRRRALTWPIVMAGIGLVVVLRAQSVVDPAAALVAMAVDPAVATWLVAAGWLGHGIWDLVHLARNRVVAPSFAEWCGVFDIGVAAQLVLLA